ncbi:ABC transporter permease [Massilia sp. BSC265]|uniref:ABC transporter permease n=1 Tax=Massilia sp. BSC265 TaxID=1549812 RepID=UPI0004E8ACF2|nr:ABC transporter permease [Massilia sp. BSC265]KFI08926.1 sulfonate ABC transporter permease [Massilia sp. BSC265]
MDRLNRIWPPLLVLAAIVLLWWAAIAHSGSLIFPSPQQVAAGALELARDGTLWQHIAASLVRVATGFLLALVVALPLGLWMGRVDGAYRTLNPIFQIMRPISPIAWIPIAILWFGVGDVAPVFLIFLAAVFPLIVQTSAGVHAIDGRYLRAAENFGVPRAKLFRQVIVPAVLPEVLTGMRIALGVAWLVVVAAEMIVRSSGLGFLIMDARNAGNRYDLVVAAMIIIGLIGLGLDALMRRLEGLKQVRWRYGR